MEHSVESIIKEVYSVIKENSADCNKPEWEKWHIGLTIYPNQEKSEHGKPDLWHSWKAETPSEALEVESYFANKYPVIDHKSSGKYDYFVYIFRS